MSRKRKSLKKAELGALLISLSFLPAQAAVAETAVLNMSARIASSFLAVTSNQSLDFDAFLAGGGAGTLKIDADGTPTYTGVTAIGSSAPKAGNVTITGNNGVNVVLTVTDPTVTLAHSTAATSMVVDQFNVETNGGGPTQTVSMTSTTINVPIGATLNVGASQPTGTYSGTVSIQAVYQ